MGSIQRGLYGGRARGSPQLLQALKRKVTPTLTPTLPLMQMGMPMDLGQAQTETPPPLRIKKEDDIKSEDPVIILLEGKRKWVCLKCNKVLGSQNGCDAHIRQTHTGNALVCAFCSFSTYNLDLLHRHEKEHN